MLLAPTSYPHHRRLQRHRARLWHSYTLWPGIPPILTMDATKPGSLMSQEGAKISRGATATAKAGDVVF